LKANKASKKIGKGANEAGEGPKKLENRKRDPQKERERRPERKFQLAQSGQRGKRASNCKGENSEGGKLGKHVTSRERRKILRLAKRISRGSGEGGEGLRSREIVRMSTGRACGEVRVRKFWKGGGRRRVIAGEKESGTGKTDQRTANPNQAQKGNKQKNKRKDTKGAK